VRLHKRDNTGGSPFAAPDIEEAAPVWVYNLSELFSLQLLPCVPLTSMSVSRPAKPTVSDVANSGDKSIGCALHEIMAAFFGKSIS
jgi:hypothetical protein